MFKASNGGKSNCSHFVNQIIIVSFVLDAISKIREKLWLTKYTISETNIVRILDINVEKKKTSDNNISNLKNVNKREKNIKLVICMSLKNNTIKNKIDCNNIINKTVEEKPKNLPSINSYLFIGLLKIRKIVFHSTSLKRSWLQTNNTQTNQNISIIDKPKSTIILLSSQIVNLPRSKEKTIKINAKKRIKYRNLFLTTSLNVLSDILNIFYISKN